MRSLHFLACVIIFAQIACRGDGGGGVPVDGDADSDVDGDDDVWAPPGEVELTPVCRSGCPDDFFRCTFLEDGSGSCEGQRPATPDRGYWSCEIAGPFTLSRASFVCFGDTMPSAADGWSCVEEEYEGVICSRETYWPDRGEERFWDCSYVGDNLMCVYEPGTSSVCPSAPCPETWFTCDELTSGRRTCESGVPATPDRGIWSCEVVGAHTLEDAVYVCYGNDMPSDASGWSCEEEEYEGAICSRDAFWPDTGDEGRWDCSYLGESLMCILEA